MTRSAMFVACVSLLCLGATSRAQADEVKSFEVILTGGTLVFDPTDAPSSPGRISVEGTPFSMEGTSRTGFGIQALGDPNQSFVEPILGCLVCAPGDHIGTGIFATSGTTLVPRRRPRRNRRHSRW